MTQLTPKAGALARHGVAGALALLFIWQVSTSAYVQTGVQFVAPLAVIMLVHLGLALFQKGFVAGLAQLVLHRAAQTIVFVLLGVFALHLVAPTPAEAMDSGQIVGAVLMVLFCVAVVAAIAAVVAGVIYAVYRAVRALFGKGGAGPQTRAFDVASLALAFVVLGAASLEGVPGAYRFATAGQGAASVTISAPPPQVWRAMERTTSPRFPLPEVLMIFPRPTAVLTDEGMRLGGLRRVRFDGREGTGILTLQVVERGDTRAVMQVLSDTSPIAVWVGHQRLIYDVVPDGAGTRLTITMEFERRLAPAWAFGPMMRGSMHLAMGVLARDIKTRTEGH